MASQHCYMSHEKTEKPKMPGPNKKTAKNNNTLPYNLKTGIERLSGVSMDDVTVHYNSPQPAQLQALAYTQGTDIHIAAGQEKHLPHEAWNVVQQKRRRVQPTTQITGVPINDDNTLEHEADVMGEKALQLKSVNCNCIQREKLGEESFSFMKKIEKEKKKKSNESNENDESNKNNESNEVSIERPTLQPTKGDIFSLTRYDIHTLDTKIDKTCLQRDHIIPYNMIMKFANEVCKLNDNTIKGNRKVWFINGVKKMKELGESGSGDYYNVGDLHKPLNEYDNDDQFNTQAICNSITDNKFNDNFIDREKFYVIHKAISWMPGNIMIAPFPKEGDTHSGDDFDETCKNVIPDVNYGILKNAYTNMKNFLDAPKKLSALKGNDVITLKIKERLNTKALQSASAALVYLQKIITWNGPYAFDPKQWLYVKTADQKGAWKNNLKSEADSFVEIESTITKAEDITKLMLQNMNKLEHLSRKEYPQFKTTSTQWIHTLQHSITIIQQYYNLPIRSNIEIHIQKWRKVCQTFETRLNAIAVKYQKHR